ncbi:MAG: ribosome biogenesis GTPase Der, partial [Chloroflexi bacterium]|nr:ribosome biogenesis GTPase Der [Chloroflexota bacterium]
MAQALMSTIARSGQGTGKPLVAIVGRANVGKSSLFNRIVGRRVAIVEDLPGTTRDRLFADTSWEGKDFTLIDTGGLEMKPLTARSQNIKDQVQAAVSAADVVLFVVDVRDGLVASDWDIADSLRGVSSPVILVANKADDIRHDSGAAEFNKLGFGEPIATSAHHGRNVPDMLDRIASLLPEPIGEEERVDYVKAAIVGRPNVGKSLLMNALLGEERAIVSDVPGTTRDSLDTIYRSADHTALLIDTAGVRRRGQVQPGIEYYSVLRTLRAIDRSDVSLLVIDGSEGVTAQDLHIAGYIHDAFKGMEILVNKWDLVGPEKQQEVSQRIEEKFKFVSYAPVAFISAKLGLGIDSIIPEAERIWRERQLRIPEESLSEHL